MNCLVNALLVIHLQIWLADWLVANNPNKPRVQEEAYVVEEPED